MNELSLIVFVVAFGFVTSALVTFLCNLIGGHEKGFQISFDSKGQIVAGFALCMFAGPYLTMKNTLCFWREGLLSYGILTMAFLVCLLWSFFSGVLVTQLLVAWGLIGV